MRRRRWPWVLAGLGVAALAAAWAAAPLVESAAFILDLTGAERGVRRWLPVRTHPVTFRDLTVPTRHGPVAARLYAPDGPSRRTLAVFPGVHAGGVDEPRLAAFSRRLAATGATVLSAPLPDLRAFAITTRATDQIEDATAWLAADRSLAPAGQVGLVGVSFAGGLALVAAGRPALAGRLQLVVSVGGHGDLPRVLRYLCTGRLADGTERPPHDYGVAVILLAAADRLVPPDQVDALRRAVLVFLTASSVWSRDPAEAEVLFAEARRLGGALPEPARTLARQVDRRDVAALGARLEPLVEDLGGAAALSPSRSPAPAVPVFLIHGAGDSVIPAEETPWTAADLRARGTPRLEWLVTPLLSHATVTPDPAAGDAWRLVRFWARMLAAADAR